MKDYTPKQQEVYELIEQARARSPEHRKLAAEVLARQGRMTPADVKRAIDHVVKDTALAGD